MVRSDLMTPFIKVPGIEPFVAHVQVWLDRAIACICLHKISDHEIMTRGPAGHFIVYGLERIIVKAAPFDKRGVDRKSDRNGARQLRQTLL